MLLSFTSGHIHFIPGGYRIRQAQVTVHTPIYSNSTISRTAQTALNWEIYGVLYGVRGSCKLTVPCAPCPQQTGSSATHGCKIKPVCDHPGVATLCLTVDDRRHSCQPSWGLQPNPQPPSYPTFGKGKEMSTLVTAARDRQYHSCWAHPTSVAALDHGHNLLLTGKTGACTEAFAFFPWCFPAHLCLHQE